MEIKENGEKMEEYYDLSEKIYEKCLVYYEEYESKSEHLSEVEIELEKSFLIGFYQAMNLVTNNFLLNTGINNKKYNELLDLIEKNIIFSKSTKP